MQKNLFEHNVNVFQVKYPEFVKHVRDGNIIDVTLAGHEDRGFFVHGSFLNMENNNAVVLINQRAKIRFIKCPDVARTFLYGMGIKTFNMDTSNYHLDKSFNPHQASQESRVRKRRRQLVTEKQNVYFKKYLFSCKTQSVKESLAKLIDFADQQRILPVAKTEAFSLLKELTIDESVTVDIPKWALQAAVVLSTLNGVIPRNVTEMGVFTRNWRRSFGPFEDEREFYASLPAGFKRSVIGQTISPDEMLATVKDEVLLANHPARSNLG